MAMGIEKSECPLSNPMIPWVLFCQSTHWIFKELQSETKVVGKVVFTEHNFLAYFHPAVLDVEFNSFYRVLNVPLDPFSKLGNGTRKITQTIQSFYDIKPEVRLVKRSQNVVKNCYPSQRLNCL